MLIFIFGWITLFIGLVEKDYDMALIGAVAIAIAAVAIAIAIMFGD